ncbi:MULTISPECIES: ATP-binding protein [unclassified Rhodococcus (in: high G+C Gram-positive bacteria)]|uniref:ATP-binding protein n=1 Tax=unclassified Rhodococcus (in: high G+C Gram-positive bacteria) TaxID=192944 RepID=UPI000B9B55B9|nr:MULTISPECIES: ATP-binding protein [unclassified Rhodococcus (in: high G+C Gram-positive bacteria)]OZE37721.1 anti-sigma regulatory factor [Rhodococcus sp. 05-2254-4]OZE40852.1 anti-sigma regulatory factor [Rhodococcus sp. 05-2254-3]OZE45844.1 anti-sigma regulatory factor [Rhodococcus sp. 05-2254-2]OZF52583.1 anti-sigma regulatory factor [Rhodococcus sp. 14-1411-2a]
MTESSLAPSRWTHTASAEPAVATALRRRLHQWVVELGVRNDLVDDIVLGVYEALANVVEHAYHSAPEAGTMTITAAYEHRALTVTISDTGTWRPPNPTTNRSHGLQLAAAVADDLMVDHRPGFGTMVTAVWTDPMTTDRSRSATRSS